VLMDVYVCVLRVILIIKHAIFLRTAAFAC
jgi:hypothetical protein